MREKKRFGWAGAAALALIQLGCEKDPVTSGLQGIVELDERVIAFELPGRLLSIEVERGDRLQAGGELAQLDPTLEEIQLNQLLAQAKAEQAQLNLLYKGTRPEEIEQARARVRGTRSTRRARLSEYERTKQLYASDSVPQRELDLARGVFESAQADYDQAQKRLEELQAGPRKEEIQAGEAALEAARAAAELSRERIRRHSLLADADAEVLDVPAKFGEFVASGTPIVVVADSARPYVDTFIPQERVAEIQVGQVVQVCADSLQVCVGGRVEHLARKMEYSPRFLFSPKERPYLVLRARVRIADPERKLRAGIPAFVHLKEPAAGVPLPPAPKLIAPNEAKPGDGAKPDDTATGDDKSGEDKPSDKPGGDKPDDTAKGARKK